MVSCLAVGVLLRFCRSSPPVSTFQTPPPKHNRERESRGEKVEEEKTQSGIENWHLGVPTWAEGAKPSYMKTRRKTVLCQQWLDARKDRKAPQGAPPWWGCPRGRGCDFAHGKVG